MCCKWLAGNTGRKNDAKNRHQRTIAQLCRTISSQLRHVSTIGKTLLSSNISPTCPYNMVNFGSLAAEIVSLVWSTPENFNVFHVLAALLHSQTAALNRGRHLYSAGRPSRWALAHISSLWSPYVIGQTIYIFMLWFVLSSFFLFFIPRLISAAAGWMSAILPHMVWP